MKRLTATEVARRFSEVLDAVETRRETYVVVRGGRPVASIAPAAAVDGRAVKDLLAATPRDAEWAAELRDLRAGLAVEDRRWSD